MASLGAINKAYVSAVDSMLDTRVINPNITDIYNENRLTDILTIANRTQPTEQPVYYTWVNEGLFKQIDTTGATVTNNNSATVTITGVTAATSGYNRVNDEGQIATTNKIFIISSVTTTSGQDTIIIKSVDGTNLAVTAGNILNIFSVAVGERSDTPLNLRYGLTKYANKVQIYRETSQITDIQNMSTVEITINGQRRYIVKDHLDKTTRMKGLINGSFIGGQLSGTSFSDTSPFLVDNNAPTNGGGGGAIQTTRGLDKYIETYSSAVTAAGTLGTVVAADYTTMQAALTAARAPLTYMVLAGKAALGANDAYWKNLGSSGITSVRMEINGTDVNTTVQQVTNGGYTYNFVALPILDHPTMFGGSIIAKSMYFIPKDAQAQVYGGGNQPAMQIRYMPQQSNYTMANTNGLIGEIQTGALNTVNPTGTIAEMRTDWYTVQGLEALGVQWFGRMRVLS